MTSLYIVARIRDEVELTWYCRYFVGKRWVDILGDGTGRVHYRTREDSYKWNTGAPAGNILNIPGRSVPVVSTGLSTEPYHTLRILNCVIFTCPQKLLEESMDIQNTKASVCRATSDDRGGNTVLHPLPQFMS